MTSTESSGRKVAVAIRDAIIRLRRTLEQCSVSSSEPETRSQCSPPARTATRLALFSVRLLPLSRHVSRSPAENRQQEQGGAGGSKPVASPAPTACRARVGSVTRGAAQRLHQEAEGHAARAQRGRAHNALRGQAAQRAGQARLEGWHQDHISQGGRPGACLLPCALVYALHKLRVMRLSP